MDIDRKVRVALVPGCGSLNEFAVKMRLDAMLADPDFTREKTGPDLWLTEWGYTIRESAEEQGVEVDSPIHSMEDISRYVPPDFRAPGRYETIEKTLAVYGQTHAVIAHLNDVFSIPRTSWAMRTSSWQSPRSPKWYAALVTPSVDVNLAMAREVAARGVEIVYTGDVFAGDP